MTKVGYDICTAVVGHLPHDARVWKQARSLASAGYSVKLIGHRYDLEGELRYTKDGVDVVEFPFGPRAGEVSDRVRATAVLRLWLEAVSTKARAYHAHNVHTFPSLYAAARARRAQLVYDGHELYGERTDNSVLGAVTTYAFRLIERRAVRHSDRVITTNASRVEVLARRHGRDGIVPLANVPYPIETIEPFDPGFPKGVPILLYQGGIYAEARAFRESIMALAQLPEVNFVILGFGRDRDLWLIRDWASKAGVSDRVHLLGPQPFDRLVHIASQAQAGLVPLKPISENSWLGDTNKLFEYLMAGVPVVASEFPEVARIARQGNPPVGETFDPGDPSSIATAIRRVLDDPCYDDRCREARRLALAKYNWNIESERLVGLYGALIRPSRPAGAER